MKEKEDCLANMLRYVKKAGVRLDGLACPARRTKESVISDF